MKKKHKCILLLLVISHLSFIQVYSQTLSLNQQNSLFSNWTASRGKSIASISTQLKQFNSKWSIKTLKPEVDGYSKSYYWSAQTEMGEPQYYILTVEEDQDSYKFSVRYLFYHLGEFTKMVTEMRNKSISGQFNEQHDGSKETYTVLVRKPNLDYFLTEQKLVNDNGKKNTTYTVDIISKYIDKK